MYIQVSIYVYHFKTEPFIRIRYQDKFTVRTVHTVTSSNQFTTTADTITDLRVGFIFLQEESENAINTTSNFLFHSVRTTLKIPKIVPIETPQSMLEEPSKGSKVTTYLPR